MEVAAPATVDSSVACPLGTRSHHICAPYCSLKAEYLERRRRYPLRRRSSRSSRPLPPVPEWGVRLPYGPDGGRCDLDWSAFPALRSAVRWERLCSIAGSSPVPWERYTTPWRSAVPVRTALEAIGSGGREWITGWSLLRLEVLAADRWQCLKCGTHNAVGQSDGLEVDHVVPLVKSGRRRCWRNLQTLCCSCNRRKYTATDDYRSAARQADAVRRCRERRC